MDAETAPSVADGLPPPLRLYATLCIILGVTLAGLDSAIANIALPTIARELSSTEAGTVWVVNGYQLAVTICLLPAAAFGETQGLKRIYALGLTIFTVASLGCALAPGLPALVAMRMAQGVGGACMSALGGALIRFIYPRAQLGRGYALIALTVAISAAVGPTIAALILSVAAWPWLFLINVPLGCLAVPLFLRVMPPSQRRPRKLDYAGAGLNAVAFGLLVVGVAGLSDGGVWPVAEVVAGLVSLVVLVIHQSRRPLPLLPLDLMRIPLFALSVGTSICSYAAQILAYVSLPFLFQTVLHRSAVVTGLLVTPWPLLVAVVAPVAGRLVPRYPAALLGSAGLAVLCGGLVLLAGMPAAPADWDIAWRMGICGVGFGFFQTPNNTALMTAGPADRSGAASAMVAVARTVGWSTGSAVVALIFGLGGSAPTVGCLTAAAVFAGLGAVISVMRAVR